MVMQGGCYDPRVSLERLPISNIRTLQVFINAWANKTFPDRIPEAALTKLVMEEVPELLTHRKEKGTEAIGGEMADCFILLLDLCEIWGIDIAQAIHDKMEINRKRSWDLDTATGFYHHTCEGVQPLESEGGTHD